MDYFTHFVKRLIRGGSYSRRAKKVQIALAIEAFRSQAAQARDAARAGESEHARMLARGCREDWKIIRKWLHA